MHAILPKQGRYHTWADGNLRWYRDENGFNAYWYVYVADETGEQIGDGEWTEINPARELAHWRHWFRNA